MAKNLFQKVEFEAFRAGITPRTRESRAWFRKRVQNMRVNRRELMASDPIEERSRSASGSMYMFFYDAKHRDTLPYWDAFPLIVAVGPAPKGFYGMNLHYLPIPLRAKFLDELMEITNNKRFDETTKFNVSYSFLKRAANMRYFKPCYKHYLTSQVDGNLSYIPPRMGDRNFLTRCQWQKGGRSQAYADARKMVS